MNIAISIVSVVKDDLSGLRATLESAKALAGYSYEHWVIDGSDGTEVRKYLTDRDDVKWISEPDSGHFDAMNKGLDRATGAFVLFLNAGDVISTHLDSALLFARAFTESRVLIGHTIERYGAFRWLRPGLGRESDVFRSPAHQATFYPRAFYSKSRYLAQLRVGADGEYTDRAIKQCGAVYFPSVVSEFGLGGLSSSYRSCRVFIMRFTEEKSVAKRSRLIVKYTLWRIIPRGLFYSLLAATKYTRVTANQSLKLTALELTRSSQHDQD
jgi:putative colanic acid biosynthesis glycosyltransferase